MIRVCDRYGRERDNRTIKRQWTRIDRHNVTAAFSMRATCEICGFKYNIQHIIVVTMIMCVLFVYVVLFTEWNNTETFEMSFFSSLHQIVTSGVANLNLSPKRFSLSKESGTDGDEATGTASATAASSRSASTGSVSGIPRIVTPQGSGGSRSSGPRRTGSFRQISQPRNPLAFCRRKSSWPEIDQSASSGWVAKSNPLKKK